MEERLPNSPPYDATVVRMVSASLGSILTALAVTPLDVVKVRQQAANSAPSINTALSACSRCGAFILNNGLICGETILAKSKSPHFLDCVPQPPARSLGAAAIVTCPAGCGCVPAAPVASLAVSNGSATSHVAASYAARPPFPTSTLAGLRYIYVREGVAGIYAGLAPTLVMAVPATVLYFTAYDNLKMHFGQSNNSFAPALSGMAARVLASAATSPFELVRTLMQSEAGSSASVAAASAAGASAPIGLHHTTTIGSFRAIVASSGVTGLWRGLEPTLWRDVPFSAVYWLLLEHARTRLRRMDTEHVSSSSSSSGGNSSAATGSASLLAWAQDFASGAGAGMLAASITTPMDVAKTRRQVFAAASDATMDGVGARSNTTTTTSGISTTSSSRPQSSSISSTSTSTSWRSAEGASAGNGSTPRVLHAIWQTEGWAGLFRGHSARVLKITPACAIMISSYEAGKRAFGLDS